MLLYIMDYLDKYFWNGSENFQNMYNRKECYEEFSLKGYEEWFGEYFGISWNVLKNVYWHI